MCIAYVCECVSGEWRCVLRMCVGVYLVSGGVYCMHVLVCIW